MDSKHEFVPLVENPLWCARYGCHMNATADVHDHMAAAIEREAKEAAMRFNEDGTVTIRSRSIESQLSRESFDVATIRAAIFDVLDAGQWLLNSEDESDEETEHRYAFAGAVIERARQLTLTASL